MWTGNEDVSGCALDEVVDAALGPQRQESGAADRGAAGGLIAADVALACAGITNASVMAEYAVSLGVPAANVIEEDQSLNTYENLYNAMQIIRERNFRQPTLVTLDLYTRRAVATARKMGWENFYWLSAYSRGEPAYGYKWLQTHSRFTLYLYEVLAMVYSKIVGWV